MSELNCITVGRQQHKPTILVVNDERVIADTLAIIFRQHGFQARAAYDFPDAILLLDKIAPDLIITDDVMPNGLGSDLCAEVRSRPETAALPIIMMGDKLGGEAFESGADVVFPYPTHPIVLLDWVKKLLTNYRDFQWASRRMTVGQRVRKFRPAPCACTWEMQNFHLN